MVYTAAYAYGDVAAVVFDFLTATFVGMITQAGPFGSLIILAAILILLTKVIKSAFNVIGEFLEFSRKN